MMARSLKDGRGALGTTTTMPTTTGLTGGRGNANDFAGYINKDDDDDPIGEKGGVVAPKRQRGRRMEKKEDEEDDDEGMASRDDDSGEGEDIKGGTEYDSFFRPSMAWVKKSNRDDNK